MSFVDVGVSPSRWIPLSPGSVRQRRRAFHSNRAIGFSCGRTYERRMQLRNHPGATLTVTVPLTESRVDRKMDVEKGIKTTRVEAVGELVEEYGTLRPVDPEKTG